jgi:hypothetical protein
MAMAVWALRLWITPPHSGFQNFIYLCKLCGAGSLVYLAALAALRMLPVARATSIWPADDNS